MYTIRRWLKIGDEVVLAENHGKRLTVQSFQNPNTGKVEEYSLLSQRDWSVVLAITEDKQVLVVREYKQGRDSIDNELPAGTAEFEGETPNQVMMRELHEETGYEAGEMISLGHMWIATRNSPTKAHLFLATGCNKVGSAKVDENEDIELRLIPLEVWLAMVTSGLITEPSAVVATMRSLPLLKLTIVPF